MKRIIIFFIAAVSCIGIQAQEKRWAVVELSSIYMRQQPDYESPLETQELMGTVVEITGEQRYWKEIISPQPYKAWTTEKGLVEMNEEQIQAYEKAAKVMFTDLHGRLYTRPSTKSRSICDLVGGDLMRLVRKRGAWTEVMLPSGRKGWVKSSLLKDHEGFISIKQGEGNADSISDELMEKIIAEAEKLVGVPYLWGGMSVGGLDCSGLVRLSYLMHGILLPRNASQQFFCGDRVEEGIENLRRGDLVFFGTPASEGKRQRVTHVGIYLGNNHIIHSSQVVRINSLLPSDADYYENSHRLLGATRL